MKIDTAIKAFVERYDAKAIESIDTLSQNYGLTVHKLSVPIFNMNEAYDNMNKFIRGYAEYKIQNLHNEKATPQDEIEKTTKEFIETKVFTEADVLYSELPKFIESYVNGINGLSQCIEESKRMMVDGEVDAESIGVLNEWADVFMDKMEDKFNVAMESLLWASGYNGHKKLSKPATISKMPVFL